MAAAQLVQQFIILIVNKVVGDDARREVATPGVNRTTHAQQPVFINEAVEVRHVARCDGVKQPLADLILHRLRRGAKLFQHRARLQRSHVDRLERPAGDDERDDGDVRPRLAQPMIQPRQCFDGHVHALVAVLVAPGSEEVERLVEVEAVAGEEMPHREFVDALLVHPVQVLELVQRGEPLNV